MRIITGIYKIQSIIKPDRIYIGSATSIDRRWKEHIYKLRRNIHHNSKLQNHYNKYGENDLMFSVLIGCENSELLKWEQYYIDSLKVWFNISPTAGNNLGIKASIETRRKISASNLGRKWSDESRKKLSETNKGRVNSEAAREKLRIINTGKKLSDELKLKISLGSMGRVQSEETKKKMSESAKLRWRKKVA